MLSAPRASAFPALISRDRVLDLSRVAELGRPPDTMSVVAGWDSWLSVLDGLAAADDGWQPLAVLQVHPPVDPRQIFQAGANYRSHVMEIAAAQHDGSDGRTAAEALAESTAQLGQRLDHPPFVFLGLPSAVGGAYDDVVLPADGVRPDWELELAAVIGRRTRRVGPDKALEAVAGWTIVNDITLRERAFPAQARRMGAVWLSAKHSPTFLPTGPVVVSRSAIPDPGDLLISLRLNCCPATWC